MVLVLVESTFVVDISVPAGVVVLSVLVSVFEVHEAIPTARNRADTFSRLFIFLGKFGKGFRINLPLMPLP